MEIPVVSHDPSPVSRAGTHVLAITPAVRRRSLTAVMSSILAVGMTMGITAPLLSLLIERLGHGASVSGLNASAGAAAVALMAPVVPRLVRRIGALGAMYVGAALTAVAILAVPAADNVWFWFVLRFLMGVGISVHWVVGETWLNTMATDANRGLIAGIYSTVLGIGFAAGPMVVAAVGLDGLLPFAVSAGLLLLSALPLMMARRLAPRAAGHGGQSQLRSLLAAPTIMAAVFACGFIDLSILSLLPVYALRGGLSEDGALILLTVLISGTVAMQIPTGWLADRFGRFRLLIVCAVVGALCPLLVPYALDIPALLWPVLFLWGGTTVSLYTLALALLGERFTGDALASANSTMVIAYCVGSIIGPAITGAAMQVLGAHAMPLVLAAVPALFAAGALTFRNGAGR